VTYHHKNWNKVVFLHFEEVYAEMNEVVADKVVQQRSVVEEVVVVVLVVSSDCFHHDKLKMGGDILLLFDKILVVVDLLWK
jgi:hypothetical protein